MPGEQGQGSHLSQKVIVGGERHPSGLALDPQPGSHGIEGIGQTSQVVPAALRADVDVDSHVPGAV